MNLPGEDVAWSAWSRAILARAIVLGMAIGAIATAGSFVVVSATGEAGPLVRSIIAATVLVAGAVGLWAGAPIADQEELPLPERWVAAAAMTALGGSFVTFRALYEPAFPGPWWSVGAILLGLAIPIYAAALVAPVLFAWGERGLEGEEVGDGWGALGPLTVGGLGGVGIGIMIAGVALAPSWSPAALLMAGALLLILPLVLPAPPAVEIHERALFETVSPFGALRVTEVLFPGERQPERRLYLNGEEESGELVRSGAPTLAYIAAAESWLSATTPPGASYLFLGGGAYTLPRRISERDPRARVLAVELDPEVTRLAERFFGLRSAAAVGTVHGDARAFLHNAHAESFDRIYLDVYAGSERLPHSLVTAEAAGEAARALSSDGVFAANVIANAVSPERVQLWSIVRTFATVFPSLALYAHLGPDFPERQNFLLAASLDPDRHFPPRAGRFEIWPQDRWPADDGAVVYHDLSLPPEELASLPARPTGAPATRPRPRPRALPDER